MSTKLIDTGIQFPDGSSQNTANVSFASDKISFSYK
jgi:hypothetical protein